MFIAQICCCCEVNILGNSPSVSGGVVGRLLFLFLFREVKISFLTIVFFLFSFLFGEVKMAAPIHPNFFWYPPLEFRTFMCARIHHFAFKLLQFFRFQTHWKLSQWIFKQQFIYVVNFQNLGPHSSGFHEGCINFCCLKPVGKSITEMALARHSRLVCPYFSNALTLTLYPSLIKHLETIVHASGVQIKHAMVVSGGQRLCISDIMSLTKSA